MSERWLWKATIAAEDSVEIFEWAIADDIGQFLNWVNGTIADEEEVIQIERISLAEILPEL